MELSNNILIVFAILGGIGILGVTVVTVTQILYEAEAKGCPPGSVGANAAQGRCINPGAP